MQQCIIFFWVLMVLPSSLHAKPTELTTLAGIADLAARALSHDYDIAYDQYNTFAKK
ncbi:MAG: hypothetical protein Q9M28_10705 [Mariprofundaceae bacterium]|nr:hypothetical protein [Mariprofundaceae bacterium]